MTRRGFGSDNHSGAHPRMLEAMAAANDGHSPAYGGDVWTERAIERIRGLLGDECDVHFTLTGTGANVVALGSLCHAYEAVICPETAHINIDECGAPEHVATSNSCRCSRPTASSRPSSCDRT